ncbi:hypothetical protein HYX08_05310 [Candidatus Woesearchaeota archaeon]|nr:hypothetical protein [Candidatus Woesearchaeota archaeon]
MDKLRSFLIEWTINFIKNRDIVAKKIEKIENGQSGSGSYDIYVKYKDREQFFMIAPKIEDIEQILQKISSNFHFSIVTLNSKGNFDEIVRSWGKLVNFKFLSIIFVNPFSELDKKWIIFPYTHHRISDESSLKTGLKAMFEMVDPIEEGKLTAKITS